MSSRELGKITSYNGSYAFIRPQGEGRDLFAHESHLQDGDVHAGDKVTFSREPDPRKPGKEMAVNVRLVDADEQPAQAGMYGDVEGPGTGALAEQLKGFTARDQQ